MRGRPLLPLLAYLAPLAVEDRVTMCSWERWWKRRFRVYKGGTAASSETPVWDYADRIVTDARDYVPKP